MKFLPSKGVSLESHCIYFLRNAFSKSLFLSLSSPSFSFQELPLKAYFFAYPLKYESSSVENRFDFLITARSHLESRLVGDETVITHFHLDTRSDYKVMRQILLACWKADRKGSSKIGTLGLMLMLI